MEVQILNDTEHLDDRQLSMFEPHNLFPTVEVKAREACYPQPLVDISDLTASLPLHLACPRGTAE